ncbi:hypothetical protein WJX75_006402 [Coccomyxa subellipsoidea]|uniref:Uncharacterized protein n=1 Tax=Coccomyxa subellipsoidea TaxID=248742 RepID=A0ABR2YI07_9CHLO
MWTIAAILILLGSADAAIPGVPAVASIVAHAQLVAAFAPTVARAFGESVVGQSGICRIPANGGMLINAPLDVGNPMASSIQPYTHPATHTAHVNSADDLWGNLSDAINAQNKGDLIGEQQKETLGTIPPNVAQALGAAGISTANSVTQAAQTGPPGISQQDFEDASLVFRSTGEDFNRGIIEKALATGAVLTPGTDAGLSFFDGLETGIELGRHQSCAVAVCAGEPPIGSAGRS